ncbi:hypothetical protein HDU87_003078 [Geranomyces variabilis]|uniref:NAD-dependent epimerase/dehydratase domain-containing protein n=1 Tax=Geranomyces variabilis TaxID=109894 RepID=A0AAD5TKA7_9FUNG|nr:hypothetical protein HDU87_003078 [Geranomyces variabilis]
MCKTILVTGSSGQLGTALMWALPAHGYHAIGLDVAASATTTYVGSFYDASLVRQVFTDNDISFVLHTGTLHTPHIETHTKQNFIDTNVSGTLLLLEQAVASGRCLAFIFTSTTSLFGRAFSSVPGQPAAWIDETVVPLPKNIYGITKIAAESMCELVHRQSGMPVLVLRTSRFFTGQDNVEETGWTTSKDDNRKVNELAYRRVDISDVVDAHICAMEKARGLGWGTYIISAPTPFSRDAETLRLLDGEAPTALRTILPAFENTFAKRGWSFLARLDRVYDSTKAIIELGWKPRYTFEAALAAIDEGKDWRSDLAVKVSQKVGPRRMQSHEPHTVLWTGVALKALDVSDSCALTKSYLEDVLDCCQWLTTVIIARCTDIKGRVESKLLAA